VGADVAEIAADAGDDAILRDLVAVRRRVGGGQVRLRFLVGPQLDHALLAFRQAALAHLAVGGDEEAVFIDTGVNRQAGDQADVGAFGRLDGADAAVVRDVYVAHLEAGALAVQAARSERRQPAL